MSRYLTIWLSCLLAVIPAHAVIDSNELLDPGDAFILSAYAQDSDTIIAEWSIAEGYYLYRDRFRFNTSTEGVELGSPQLPAGMPKVDPKGEQVEIYRNSVTIEIPVEQLNNGATALTLKVVSQGCSDDGVCYLPFTQSALLSLPTATPTLASSESSSFSSLKKLGASLGLGGGSEEFLQVDEAFNFVVDTPGNDRLLVRWHVADGYYLYRDKLSFTLKSGSGATLDTPQLPSGKIKQDEYFGRMEIYNHDFEVVIPLQWQGEAGSNLTLEVGYQGCADEGLCYPPESRDTEISLPTEPAAAATSASSGTPRVSEQDRIATLLQEGSLWFILLAFFGFGLLLTFTPCVLPMVPILSSIIVGQGERITTHRAFILSLAYVIPMALTYTAAGVAAGLFGSNLQAAFQEPWILISFSLIFVLLSLSMFGFYELQMPSAIQNRINRLSHSQQGGTLIGVVIMGFLSALIVGPCVAAPLAGALIYIGQSGDALLGGMALFAMGMGMGTPLLLIGTSAGKILPRTGDWMNNVKSVFGVLLLAVAVWMIERIVPAPITMALWAALLIGSAIYLGAIEPLPIDASGWRKLWKGTGIILLLYGALLLIGAASGGGDPLQPLRSTALAATGPTGGTAAHEGLEFQQVKGIDQLELALTAAEREGRPVMLDFYADWCISCKELERFTFSDPTVQKILSQVLLLQADVTANDDIDKALLRHLNVPGLPSIHFFDSRGVEQRPYRLVGFLDAEAFQAHAEAAFKP